MSNIGRTMAQIILKTAEHTVVVNSLALTQRAQFVSSRFDGKEPCLWAH